MRPPKDASLRQNTRFNPSTMKIGLFVRAVREPEKVNKKKGHERYISPMRGGGTPEGGSAELGKSQIKSYFQIPINFF
jgi:hypothetical protein